MPKLYNQKRDEDIPADAVYIGRPTRWGNPYVIGAHGNRAQVIEKFEKVVLASESFVALIKKELKGKDLVCFCAPKPCHGDVLLRIANEK